MVKQLLSHTSSGWPPPPHDPRKRIWVGRIGEWEIRAFSRTHPQYEYFARQGFLHLQMWHPVRKISVLSPSRLTVSLYEMCPVRDGTLLMCHLSTVNDLLARLLHAPPIDGSTLGLMERFYVYSETLHAQWEKSITDTIPPPKVEN